VKRRQMESLLCCALLLFGGENLIGDENSDHHLQTNVLAPLFGEVTAEYVRHFGSGWGIVGRIWYWNHSEGQWSWKAYSFGASLRRSLSSDMHGFFVGFGLDIPYVTAERSGVSANSWLVTPALELGYHWQLGSIDIQPFVALEYTFADFKISGDSFPHLGIGPNVVLGFGIQL